MEDATPRPLAPRLLAAAMAVPIVLALFAHLAGPTPAPVAPAPPRGSLVFDQYLTDLQEVEPSELVYAHFDFTNRGKCPVEIEALEPSCGCLRPRLEGFDRRTAQRLARIAAQKNAPLAAKPLLEKKIFEPGEAGFFTVHVRTANQSPGPHEYTVKVKYKDPEPHETLVTLRFVLPDELVLVRPIALMFYQVSEGSLSTEPQKFEVIDLRKEHLSIAKIECTNESVKVEQDGSYVDDAGAWHGKFLVTVPDNLPSGQKEEMVRIFTIDPADKYHKLEVPLTLVGPHSKTIRDRHLQQAGGTSSKMPMRKLRPLR